MHTAPDKGNGQPLVLHCTGHLQIIVIPFHCPLPAAPNPPSNCSVVNQTTDSLMVECLAGFNGGLPQHFKLEVTDQKTGSLLVNMTSDEKPEFEVRRALKVLA